MKLGLDRAVLQSMNSQNKDTSVVSKCSVPCCIVIPYVCACTLIVLCVCVCVCVHACVCVCARVYVCVRACMCVIRDVLFRLHNSPRRRLRIY